MATTIRVHCPTCGSQDLTPEDILLTIEKTSYYFECPACGEVIIKMTDRKITSLLVSAGVQTEETDSGIGDFDIPLSREQHFESLPYHTPPLTHDDLIEFHEKIDEVIEGLLNGT